MNCENLIYSEEEIARQRVEDAALTEERWREIGDDLASKVDRRLADETVAAFKELYTLFGPGAVEWFANLYDPVRGGYYYSNSGKETPMFRPDLESTYQALNFMSGSGLARTEDVPAWQSEAIVKFTKSLQDPNGYFYHPQWGKRVTDLRHHPRRGRDLTWAHRLLERFGAKPTYDTPLGVRGDGLLADGTLAPCCENASEHVDRIAEEQVNGGVARHLRDGDSFRKYLDGLDLASNGYYIGNLFESQSDQIAARDKQLCEAGSPESLTDILVDWLTEHQNPVTGLWTEGDGVN